MSEIVNSVTSGELTQPDRLERRIARSMIVAVSAAVVVAAIIAPWRVATGLLLGGGLSLLNFRWLHGSIGTLLRVEEGSSAPRMSLWKFAFRYLLIAGLVFGAYQLSIVSLPATIAGLCSFVIALFAEAFREFYFAIIRREESF